MERVLLGIRVNLRVVNLLRTPNVQNKIMDRKNVFLVCAYINENQPNTF